MLKNTICMNENNKGDESVVSINNVNEITNENQNKLMYNADVDNNNINDAGDCEQELFFISDVYDVPKSDSTVSVYLLDDIAYLFCFYGNMYNNINTMEEQGEFSFSNGLFITVTYKRGVSILEGLGYEKKSSDSVSFGAYIDDMHIRTMAELYREDWKRSK